MDLPVDERASLVGDSSDDDSILEASVLQLNNTLANNWRVLYLLGALNIFCGMACLLAPITASLIAEQWLSVAVILVGFFNAVASCTMATELVGVWYYLFLGTVQIALGGFMFRHPLSTLASLTLIIAWVVIVDGMVQVVWCCFHRNNNLRGWGLVLVSGAVSMILGLSVLSSLPESSLYLVGILLGVNFLTVGNVRIHWATEGRNLLARN